jgi:outer membrane lipoprotein
MIIETRNTPEGTSIEVLQRPLDRQGRPLETDDTGGRFIIESPQFLDSAVYRPGKRISLVGEVSGQEVRPLGGIHYRYPVIAAKEIRLWEPRTAPRISFGVGIGVFHRF